MIINDCRLYFFSDGPKKYINPMFFRELIREILLFYCCKTVQCVEFCLTKIFKCRALAVPHKASALPYILRRIQTPPTYIHFTHMLSDTSSRYLGTIQDNNRHQQTPNNTNRRSQAHKRAVQGCVAFYVYIKGRLLVSDGVYWRLLLSYAAF